MGTLETNLPEELDTMHEFQWVVSLQVCQITQIQSLFHLLCLYGILKTDFYKYLYYHFIYFLIVCLVFYVFSNDYVPHKSLPTENLISRN
jgi:hypothetical protein